MATPLLVCSVVHAADDPHAVAQKLAGERRFSEAAAVYRQALASRPDDWQLRLGLAQVTLWNGAYRHASRLFAALLDERPDDAAALLGYAQAAYWSRDFREAEKRYRRLLASRPGHDEAQKVLAEISLLQGARYEVRATHRDDSQPYTLSTARTTISFFSDPLTRWDLHATGGSAEGGDSSIGAIGGGVSIGLPRWRSTVDARAAMFRFPDGEQETVGAFAVTTNLPWQSAVVASVDRFPLLGSAPAVAGHPHATQYSLTWRRDPTERWLGAASVSRIEFSDGNDGMGADAWAVAPIYTRDGLTFRAGVSTAWRDSELDRFRFTRFTSRQTDSGQWRYTYNGVYDPYWTPHDLREARAVFVAEAGPFKLQADGGFARDRAVGFGPTTGDTPSPLFIVPHVQDRSFRPWRAGVEFRRPMTSRIELRASYRHEVTAYYRADEIDASLAGRF